MVHGKKRLLNKSHRWCKAEQTKNEVLIIIMKVAGEEITNKTKYGNFFHHKEESVRESCAFCGYNKVVK